MSVDFHSDADHAILIIVKSNFHGLGRITNNDSVRRIINNFKEREAFIKIEELFREEIRSKIKSTLSHTPSKLLNVCESIDSLIFNKCLNITFDYKNNARGIMITFVELIK